jgi:chemotaxis signal transduction protein
MELLEQSRQFLTFELADELYGIEVQSIREILEMQRITRIPRAAGYLLGVMNVRGRVVPVVDLRIKFGFPPAAASVERAIIVLELTDGAGDSLIGMLVDNVDEVLELDQGNIEPAPKIGTSVDSQLLSGLGKYNGNFILLLRADRLFSTSDVEQAMRSADEVIEMVDEEDEQPVEENEPEMSTAE